MKILVKASDKTHTLLFFIIIDIIGYDTLLSIVYPIIMSE